jgi:tetratricopeptide (TPR) repeat protein
MFLNDFHDKYHDKSGLKIFGIYTPEEESGIPDSEISKVKELISGNKIKFPILIDKGLKYFREYGIIALPSTIMVGKTGKIDFIYPSFPLTAGPVVSNQIKALVGVAAVEQKPKQVKSEISDAKSHRLYQYSLQMYKKGLQEQALSALNKFLSTKENHSWAHNLKGVILWHRGNSPAAIEAFKHAIAIDKNIAAHLNYTILLFEQGKYKEAEKILVSSPLTQAEYQIRAHYLLGLLYRDTNKIDQAVDELELANSLFEVWILSAKEDTHFFTFFFRIPMLRDLSDMYRKKGNDKKAIEFLHKAVDLALGLEGQWETIPLNQRKGFMVYE